MRPPLALLTLLATAATTLTLAIPVMPPQQALQRDSNSGSGAQEPQRCYYQWECENVCVFGRCVQRRDSVGHEGVEVQLQLE